MDVLWMILIVGLILVIADFIFVDLMTRYACDSTCPNLPSGISQKLLGKKVKKGNPDSPSRKRAEQLKLLADEKVIITNREGMKLAGHMESYYVEPAQYEKIVK